MPVLGTVTIGQSPRTDLIPEMKAILGAEVEVVEGGALDGLSRGEIEAFKPEAGDYVLVTRLRDGTSVKIAERHILPLMQAQIDRVVGLGADVVALVCTGSFPEFACKRPLVEPQKVLGHMVRSVGERLSIGVVVPDKDQIAQAQRRWQGAGRAVSVVAASPYGDLSHLDSAAADLRQAGCELGVLDCIGFTFEMKRRFSERLGAPCVLARSALARVLKEILSQGA
ncbi:MAG: AroM family protein [Bacillota bacterium]|nr:AroM family protein [Bacillota bacterium]